MKWYVNQRLRMELKCGDWVTGGKNNIRFAADFARNQWVHRIVQPMDLLRWNLVERTGKYKGRNVKYWLSYYVFGYRRYGRATLRMVEEENECEKLDCGIKRERYNTVWTKKQEWNSRKITKILNGTCNGIERQNTLAKLSEKSSLIPHLEFNFSWGKRLYM